MRPDYVEEGGEVFAVVCLGVRALALHGLSKKEEEEKRKQSESKIENGVPFKGQRGAMHRVHPVCLHIGLVHCLPHFHRRHSSDRFGGETTNP